MGSKMLIDATHAEETRVVVVRGTRIEEFDFESAARKLLPFVPYPFQRQAAGRLRSRFWVRDFVKPEA